MSGRRREDVISGKQVLGFDLGARKVQHVRGSQGSRGLLALRRSRTGSRCCHLAGTAEPEAIMCHSLRLTLDLCSLHCQCSPMLHSPAF